VHLVVAQFLPEREADHDRPRSVGYSRAQATQAVVLTRVALGRRAGTGHSQIDSSLQAFCKHTASAAMPPCSASKQRLAPNLAWKLHFDGTLRNVQTH
jgi:hypothetical protein